MYINPFSNRYPENMSLEQIKELFVDEFIDIPSVLNHHHHFIWGARGSGKSMLFRYIQAKCYAETILELKEQRIIDCPIFPIYYKISSNTLRIKEFSLLDSNYASLLSEHTIIISIVKVVIENIKRYKDLDKECLNNYVKTVVYELFSIEVMGSIERASNILSVDKDPLEWMNLICNFELQAVSVYLRNICKRVDVTYSGTITGYHDFLIPFLKKTKSLFGIDNLVFYLLIDEAGRSYDFQQEIINGWIACRDHDLFSIKLTSVKAEYVTFFTRDKWQIQNTHDYSESELNIVHYSKMGYKEKLKKVVQKRFAVYGLEMKKIEEFYPVNTNYSNIVKHEKQRLKKEYDRTDCKEDFSVYCSRRLMPAVYQYLSDKHLSPSYSGFDMLVSTSSGIIRNFLEPSRIMYDAVIAEEDKTFVERIPVEIQEEKINDYSKTFLDKIRFISSNPEEKNALIYLDNLVKSLGMYFRERLLIKGLTEGRIFSFTIRDEEQLDYEFRKVLQYAEQYDYLQKSFYSGKNGKVTENWYLLSRRLAPVFKIDPTALKGRVSFSVYDIQLAMRNPGEFVKRKIDKLNKSMQNKESYQISLFDMNFDEILYEGDDE